MDHRLNAGTPGILGLDLPPVQAGLPEKKEILLVLVVSAQGASELYWWHDEGLQLLLFWV